MPTKANRPQWPLVAIGLLWVAMAALIVGYELSRPVEIPVQWETETEFETAGFNVYRSTELDGEYVQLNEQLIPSEAEPAAGASYTYVDQSVEPNTTYFYLLEDVEFDGTLNRHYEDVTEGRFSRFEWWVLLSVPVCLVVGGVLLLTGWRGNRDERELPAG